MEKEIIRTYFDDSKITSIAFLMDDGTYELRVYLNGVKKSNEFSEITSLIKKYYD